MPLIPAAQLATLKRDVSIRAVLEARGIAFVKHGPDAACCCPLGSHEDTTPSFVVSERKNLWRCHGCGQGGDVLKLVQVLHGVSFRHAVELLAAGVPSFAAGEAPAAKQSSGKPVANSTRRLLPCPLDADTTDAALADQVVAYYAQRIADPNHEARRYLASRGLDHPDLIRRFAIGAADRTLGLRMPAKNRSEGERLRSRLTALGWFRDTGHEHFAGSVVFPIHGGEGENAGRVVGAYGRKVIQNLRAGTPKHLYLPGQHRGLWNDGPGVVSNDGQVVINEAIIDAASCWVSGMQHTTAAYGIHGWTADHDAALVRHRAKNAFIAFDCDAPGDAAALTLADHLIGQGCTAYRVVWPAGLKDANAVLCDPNHGPEAIRAAIAQAIWIGGAPRVSVPELPTVEQPAAKEPSAAKEQAAAAAVPFFAAVIESAPEPKPASAAPTPSIPGGTITDNGQTVVIRIGSRTYTARGLERNPTPEVLRIALRLEIINASSPIPRQHTDSIDLIQARQRAAFVRAASEETGASADLIKTDLGQVLLALEQVQHARAAAAQQPQKPASIDPTTLVSEETHAAALALLKAPDLLDRIATDLGQCGLVGEDLNKRAAILACVSRLLPSPLAVLVQSTSAAGKTTLMDAVLSFLPDEAKRTYSAISGRSPFYLGGADGGTALKHRVLAIAEEEGARRASYALKLLQSDGKLTMAATGKDPDTGKLTTHDYSVEGPVMLFLTTTAIDLDPELVNRCLVLTVDESPEQTARIHQAQREAVQIAGIEAAEARRALRSLHQHAQRLLKPIEVVIPDADRLRFAAGSSRLRRDHGKYLSIIKAVTLLHQHQRTTKTHTTTSGQVIAYLEATPADIAAASAIAGALLGRSLDDLPPQTRRLWDGLRAAVHARAAAEGAAPERIALTRREIQAAMGWSYQQVRTHLDRLCEQDYVIQQGGSQGILGTYRLVPGIEDDRPGSPVLPADTTTPAPVAAPAPTTHALMGFAPPLMGQGGQSDPPVISQPISAAEPALFTSPGITYGGHITARIASYPHPA